MKSSSTNSSSAENLEQKAKESSELLISVIRKLTSSASIDQRELEKVRLEKAFQESGVRVDALLREHQQDVAQSLGVFRRVSNEITENRQRIRAAKNALQTSKILLANRRDELKKLLKESAEQRMVCDILQQIEEIRHIDVRTKQLLDDGKFREASEALKRAEILLNGPLSTIEGLRSGIHEMSQVLFDAITSEMLRILIVEPFELRILELIRSNAGEMMITESNFCQQLQEKYSKSDYGGDKTTSQFRQSNGAGRDDEMLAPKLKKQISDAVDALGVFDQFGAAFEHIFMRMPGLCVRAINDTVLVLHLLVKSGAPDQTHFAQLIKILINQMRGVSRRMGVVVGEVSRLKGPIDEGIGGSVLERLNTRCWAHLQDVLEQCLSEHIGVWRRDRLATVDSSHILGEKFGSQQQQKQIQLFSFQNTSFVNSSGTSAVGKNRQLNTICHRSIYNIGAVFNTVNAFCGEIEAALGTPEESCKLRAFLSTAVMEQFLEAVRGDMELRLETALATAMGAVSGSGGEGGDIWATTPMDNNSVRPLVSCVRVFEMCSEIGGHIRAMEMYTQRFASLWLLIIAYYTRSVQDQYLQIVHTRSSSFQIGGSGCGDSMGAATGHNDSSFSSSFSDAVPSNAPAKIISASWVVDEDINRLLRSLPSWTRLQQLAQTPSAQTPLALSHIQTSIDDAALRKVSDWGGATYQRESELLIANLGQQRQIQRQQIITNMDHVKALICIHESLGWFSAQMRQLLHRLPPTAREIIRCRIQLKTGAGGQHIEQLLSDALSEHIDGLEQLADTCLLMLYLELRVHCFYHCLPLAPTIAVFFTGSSGASTGYAADHDNRIAKQVLEFGRDLAKFQQTLQLYTDPIKLRLLFDGLGHLCAHILIHSAQHIARLTDPARKQIQRTIYGVQKELTGVTGRPETELGRALAYYELLAPDSSDPALLQAKIAERGLAFSPLECSNLIALATRSAAK